MDQASRVYVIGGETSAFTPVAKKSNQTPIVITTLHRRKSAFRRIKNLFKCELSQCKTCLSCCACLT
jgi:hypothetical protein